MNCYESVIEKLKYFLDNQEDFKTLSDSNFVLGGYNLYLIKKDNALQISIIEKRGLYKCEDDIFFIKKVNKTDHDSNSNQASIKLDSTNQNYEFWDIMDYVQRRIVNLDDIATILIKACEKINTMYKVLQVQRNLKPALLDSPKLLFSLKNLRHCAIEYNPQTEKVKIISHNKENKTKLL